jgi:hypothetical protein
VVKQVSLAASNTRREQIIRLASFASVHTGDVVIKVTSADEPVMIDGLGVGRA